MTPQVYRNIRPGAEGAKPATLDRRCQPSTTCEGLTPAKSRLRPSAPDRARVKYPREPRRWDSSFYRFGQFELQSAERRLLANGMAVEIGPRTLDVLISSQSAAAILSPRTSCDRVLGEGHRRRQCLQAQISVLRKILGRDAIATVPDAATG